MFLVSVWFTFGWLLLASAAASNVENPIQCFTEETFAEKFVRREGGLVDPRICVGLSNGMRGVGVKPDNDSDIKEGTLLFRVPWTIIFNMEHDCETVQILAEEARSVNRLSEYRAHLNEIFSTGHSDFLMYWTDEAKKELQGLLPGDSERHVKWFEHTCQRGEPNTWDKFTRQALLYVVSYSTNLGVVPFYDLMNHHRGLHNIALSFTDDGLEVYASKTIRPGEQIWNVYVSSLSSDIFRDYGFVEDWPRRWKFLQSSWWKTTEHTFELFPDNIVSIECNPIEVHESDEPKDLETQQREATKHTNQLPEATLKAFADNAIALLSSLPTSIEEDKKLLLDSKQDGDPAYFSAVKYRLQFKQDIQTAINVAKATLLRNKDL